MPYIVRHYERKYVSRVVVAPIIAGQSADVSLRADPIELALVYPFLISLCIGDAVSVVYQVPFFSVSGSGADLQHGFSQFLCADHKRARPQCKASMKIVNAAVACSLVGLTKAER